MPHYDVYVGVDVGKSFHHVYATDGDGNRLVSRRVNQDETQLTDVFTRLRTDNKSVLVVVDQPKNIGALTVACAARAGCDTMFLPGLVMRRAAGLLPGDAKTDVRDAQVIAMAARQLPDALRPVSTAGPERADLDALVAWDADCVHDRTRAMNRLHALLAECDPMFEAALYQRLDSPFILALLIRFGGPWGIRAAGEKKVRAWAARQKRVPAGLLDDAIRAAGLMDHKPAGTDAREAGPIPAVCTRITELTRTRTMIEARIDAHLQTNDTYQMLLTMPGVGVHTAASLVTLVDITMFPTCDQLASYAGIAPHTTRSGTSIKGETAARTGNRALKNTLFLSAFASLTHDPVSRAYYDAKRAAGKQHNTALISLARHRLKIMYAIMRDKTPYHT